MKISNNLKDFLHLHHFGGTSHASCLNKLWWDQPRITLCLLSSVFSVCAGVQRESTERSGFNCSILRP